LGWLFQWSGSLWAPIVAHFAIDLITGLVLSRKLGLNTPDSEGT
jgi:membrane protease YdiL (CAAX protease family)